MDTADLYILSFGFIILLTIVELHILSHGIRNIM